ncbi:hypothetical protein SLS55_008521 [Diplodia seriata]|uniref:Uncharacterized protein n=1 Tax=Diplodia seriata TaxID=420778 RepID=A0ABR3C6L7_9PEZI
MPLFQPALHAPAADSPTVEGQTIIITGSNSGIGLETARQLLLRGAATLILAVRNIHKGELAKASLLSDPAVRQRAYPAAPHVAVMELDMADYGSVAHFAAAVQATLPELHMLLLNAGCGGNHDANTSTTTIMAGVTTDRSSTDSNGSGSGSASSSSTASDRPHCRHHHHPQHERTLQVNYLSNVLLLLSLLPLLRASAALARRPSRVTWTGSRAHALTARTTIAHLAATDLFSSRSSSPSTASSSSSSSSPPSPSCSFSSSTSNPSGFPPMPPPPPPGHVDNTATATTTTTNSNNNTLLGRLDDAAAASRWHFSPLTRYADSKLLAVMFLYEMRRRLGVRLDSSSPSSSSSDDSSDEHGGGEVVVNMFCPGMVDTRIGDALPWYLRWPLDAVKALRARSVEQAGWVAVNAAVVVGVESHGRFLGDMEVFG